MAIIDASQIFGTKEYADMEALVQVNEEMKKLESKKKVLSDKVKSYMQGLNIDNCDVNGSTFSIIETQRRTITKTTKDSFIAELVGLNKQHLVITSIEPDLDSIFAEVDAGSLDKNLVNKYVKVTPVVTLRCN